MNIYRIVCDHVGELWQAESLAGAVDAAFEQFDTDNPGEGRPYFEELVTSIENLGELENPSDG